MMLFICCSDGDALSDVHIYTWPYITYFSTIGICAAILTFYIYAIIQLFILLQFLLTFVRDYIDDHYNLYWLLADLPTHSPPALLTWLTAAGWWSVFCIVLFVVLLVLAIVCD